MIFSRCGVPHGADAQAQALLNIRGFHVPDSLLRRYSASAWAQAQAELHAHWKL